MSLFDFHLQKDFKTHVLFFKKVIHKEVELQRPEI